MTIDRPGGQQVRERAKTMERMYAVAIRDGESLFLRVRIRRAASGDIYYMLPTGRDEPEWKKWDPHGSLHKDGRSHHKSYDKKVFPKTGQKPDSSFKGSENFVTLPIASGDARAFGVICDPSKFDGVFEVPDSALSPKHHESHIAIDLTDSNGAPSVNTSDGQISSQRRYDEALPWIVVSVVFKAAPHLGATEEVRAQ